MKKNSISVFILLIASALLMASDGSWLRRVPEADRKRTNPYAGQAEAAAAGKILFMDNCAKCHGDDGKGQTTMGKRIGARDYTDAAVQASFTDADGIKAVKEGFTKDGKTLMKPFTLSDDDIKAVITYMRTFKK